MFWPELQWTQITCEEGVSWLMSGGSLGHSPHSHSGCGDALSWRLKTGGERHPESAILQTSSWQRYQPETLVCSGPYWDFSAAPFHSSSGKLCLSFRPVEWPQKSTVIYCVANSRTAVGFLLLFFLYLVYLNWNLTHHQCLPILCHWWLESFDDPWREILLLSQYLPCGIPCRYTYLLFYIFM